MRKTLLALLTIGSFAGPAMAQLPAKKAYATPAQISLKESYRPRFDAMVQSYNDQHPLVAQPAPVTPRPVSAGKISSLNPIQLGTASNALTCLRTAQNQVAVDNMTDAVVFIHRQDISVWGGAGTENGKYRYDISIDNGSSFTNDIGPIQSIYTNYGRYPNIAFFNETGTNNPLQEKIVYQGPTNRFPTPGWIGQVNGLADVVTSGAPTATEHYQFEGNNSLLPGGLCEGLPGEFWSVEFAYDGTNLMDSIRLLKGTYNSGNSDIDWVLDRHIDPGYDKTFDGSISAVGPNIAFSPDGMIGYIGILGNVLGGTSTNNETILPVVWKTTDGGATWGNAIEVDLDMIPWIADSLQTLWLDSLTGLPASDGRATTAFDYDMAVDASGNVHIGLVIGTTAGGFSISSGLAKFMADVTTHDGGATWDVTYLSPVLTFRGTYGGGSAPISIDNFPQVARDDAGNYVFFTWVDSDTSQFTGTMNGIGFGQVTNSVPNLRAVAKNLIDNTQTYPRLVTDGDILWDGRALNPTMAENIVKNGSMAQLPVVILDLTQNDPNLPSGFWYFGNDIGFDLNNPNIWCYQPLMNLGWLSISTPGSTPTCAVATEPAIGSATVQLYDWYPNPSNGTARIGFELPGVMTVKMQVTDIFGRQVATLVDGELAAGKHSASLETSQLADGLYFCQLQAGQKTYSKRLVVTH